MHVQDVDIEYNISDNEETQLDNEETPTTYSTSPTSPFLECDEKTKRMFFRDFKLLENVWQLWKSGSDMIIGSQCVDTPFLYVLRQGFFGCGALFPWIMLSWDWITVQQARLPGNGVLAG